MLRFTDDIVLLAKKIKKLEVILNAIDGILWKKFGLKIKRSIKESSNAMNIKTKK